MCVGGWDQDADVSRPTVICDTYPPEAIRGVSPPSKDYFSIKRDLAPRAVEVDVTTGVD